MIKHNYWGEVQGNWAGFSAEKQFEYFENQTFDILLGEAFDEDGEDIEVAPSSDQLNDFQTTYQNFLSNLDEVIDKIKEQTFERYTRLYAHYYENEEKSGEKPLGITTKEIHFEYIKNMMYIRVLEDGNIKNPIRYKVDTEHGLELRLENNKIIDIGGIAET